MKKVSEENKDLPYFAYDAFKPRELAFPVITYFVDHIEPIELDYPYYELKHRNGIPMVVKDISTAPIEGYLLYFNDNTVDVKVRRQNQDVTEEWGAYDFIAKSKPGDLFKWNVETYDNTSFNMTLGKKKNFGVPYKIYKGNYSGKNDPTFFDIVYYIRDNIDYMEENHEIRNNFDCLCKLQMYYMLLWSSIDKYLSLCYGGWNQRKSVKQWCEWEEFRKGFEYVKRDHEISSPRDKHKYKLIPGQPTKSIDYYYQLRCNIVHSGKKENTNVSFLKDSLDELLEIYNTVLNLSFYPERYEEYELSDWRKLLDDTLIF